MKVLYLQQQKADMGTQSNFLQEKVQGLESFSDTAEFELWLIEETYEVVCWDKRRDRFEVIGNFGNYEIRLREIEEEHEEESEREFVRDRDYEKEISRWLERV
jgi:tRNA(Ile2) C34 agmatinyltransferase TiaS